MTEMYIRIMQCRIDCGLSWDEVAQKAGIAVSSWMTGLPCYTPTDEELHAIAPVLNTTYDYLKYGTKE